ncbi:hypothetical protein ACIBKY_32765 [Nonomuraea sp. NPDC050394]|uniref:hypothetical protein n=1 Tax=Nonomuraea sp. NPDC050394 TaxID=3364363 RepID=UPI0037BB2F0D
MEEYMMSAHDERPPPDSPASSAQALERQAATETATVIAGSVASLGRDEKRAHRVRQRLWQRLPGPEVTFAMGAMVLALLMATAAGTATAALTRAIRARRKRAR